MLKSWKSWKVVMLTSSNIEMLKCWNIEMLKCWDVELLNYWTLEIPPPSPLLTVSGTPPPPDPLDWGRLVTSLVITNGCDWNKGTKLDYLSIEFYLLHITRVKQQRILYRPLGLGHACYQSSYYNGCLLIGFVLEPGSKFRLSLHWISLTAYNFGETSSNFVPTPWTRACLFLV